MIKTKAEEIIKCAECSDEITNDSCPDCNTWFENDEEIYCDGIHSHYCKKCGKLKYKKFKIES